MSDFDIFEIGDEIWIAINKRSAVPFEISECCKGARYDARLYVMDKGVIGDIKVERFLKNNLIKIKR